MENTLKIGLAAVGIGMAAILLKMHKIEKKIDIIGEYPHREGYFYRKETETSWIDKLVDKLG